MYHQIILIGGIETFRQKKINTKNINFNFSEAPQTYLSKELKNIMHKFPGDRNNFHSGAKGLKH